MTPQLQRSHLSSEVPFDDLWRHVTDSPHQLHALYLLLDHSVCSAKVQQFNLNLLSFHLVIEFLDKDNIL